LASVGNDSILAGLLHGYPEIAAVEAREYNSRMVTFKGFCSWSNKNCTLLEFLEVVAVLPELTHNTAILNVRI